ncbi:MAG TPA: hypothetical protein VFC09_11850 [Candidatus Dormibacteraeota bacterium]|nr:hypothetical protein [Candidatus Dormibacteraeota bacterium]
MKRDIVIRDAWGVAMAHCSGPAPSGACPRVGVGETVPCAGHTIVPDRPGAWLPYKVPDSEVSCPVTAALALAGSPDTR